MITYLKTVEWDMPMLADALQIPEQTVYEYFSDGRRVSFLLERRLAAEIFDGKIADSESSEHDIIDNRGNKLEVRSITKTGVSFAPSYMVGYGRTVDEQGFRNKLAAVYGYVLCDIMKFPKIPCWLVTAEYIQSLYDEGKLGKGCKLSRGPILRLLESHM